MHLHLDIPTEIPIEHVMLQGFSLCIHELHDVWALSGQDLGDLTHVQV
jgi:hypothetical protein